MSQLWQIHITALEGDNNCSSLRAGLGRNGEFEGKLGKIETTRNAVLKPLHINSGYFSLYTLKNTSRNILLGFWGVRGWVNHQWWFITQWRKGRVSHCLRHTEKEPDTRHVLWKNLICTVPPFQELLSEQLIRVTQSGKAAMSHHSWKLLEHKTIKQCAAGHF